MHTSAGFFAYITIIGMNDNNTMGPYRHSSLSILSIQTLGKNY